MASPVWHGYPTALTDGVVTLRRWEESDAGCVQEASRDEHVQRGTTVPHDPSPESALAFVERQRGRLEHGEGISFAIVADGEAVGAIVLTHARQPGAASLGYWLLERARGQGLATRAVRLITGWAFTEGGLARIEAIVEPGNDASAAVLEATGFEHEGLLRSYLALPGERADVHMYSRLSADAGH